MSAGLGFLGPLGDKLQLQGDRLDKRFCEIKGTLKRIAANSYPEHLRNDFSHKPVTEFVEVLKDDPEESQEYEAILENKTGYDWLIHAVANQGSTARIFWGATHKTGFLATLEGGDSLPFVKWFLPAGAKLTIRSEGQNTSTNFQVEIVRTPGDAAEADTGISSEKYDTVRLPDDRPTASIFEE